MAAPHEVLAEGFELGAYRIVRCIGTGGMGIVYEAVHQALGKPVALKVLRGHAAASPASRSRFVREARASSQLRHPNVVDVTDVGQVGDQAFLVMELLEGESLGSLIRNEGRLRCDHAADIGVPVVAALVEAHRHGIIHRDLKPDNIFLTRSVTGMPHPKVVDFGISKVLDEADSQDLTGEHSFVGTPSYASPEQLSNDEALTGLTDQYSFGVVLYEAVVGTNPFAGHGSIMGILSSIGAGRFDQPHEVHDDIDPRLEALILQAMAVSPADRFPSMFALGRSLLSIASEPTRAAWSTYFAGHEPPRAPPPRPSQVPGPVSATTMEVSDTIAMTTNDLSTATTTEASGVRTTPGPAAPSGKRSSPGRAVWVGLAAALLVVLALAAARRAGQGGVADDSAGQRVDVATDTAVDTAGDTADDAVAGDEPAATVETVGASDLGRDEAAEATSPATDEAVGASAQATDGEGLTEGTGEIASDASGTGDSAADTPAVKTTSARAPARPAKRQRTTSRAVPGKSPAKPSAKPSARNAAKTDPSSAADSAPATPADRAPTTGRSSKPFRTDNINPWQ